MSIQNILVPNDYTGYFENLNVAGTITAGDIIIDNITFDNLTVNDSLTMKSTSITNFEGGSQITGTANFNSTSLVNLSVGSLIEGALTIGNLAVVTIDGGSQIMNNGINEFTSQVDYTDTSVVTFDTIPTFNNGLNIPDLFSYKHVVASLSVLYTGDSTTFSHNINFYKLGSFAALHIPNFGSLVSTAGVFEINISSMTDYLPTDSNAMTTDVIDSGNVIFGSVRIITPSTVRIHSSTVSGSNCLSNINFNVPLNINSSCGLNQGVMITYRTT